MKQIRKMKLPLIIVILIVLAFAFIIYSKGSSTTHHVSKDLKISLSYPRGWYVDDRYHSILLTDYKTNQNKNDKPTLNQIEVNIDNFNAGCHTSIEENLKDPACGEGGPQVKPNEIIFKEVKQISDAIYYKYIVKSPSGNQFTFYLLEKGDRVMQISKKPDPSQHEKEFEEIVSSIRFQ